MSPLAIEKLTPSTARTAPTWRSIRIPACRLVHRRLEIGRRRVLHVVDLVVEHILGLLAGALDDRCRQRIDIAVRDRLDAEIAKVLAPLHHELTVRYRLGDHVRADTSGRALGHVLERRIPRHEAGEVHRQNVREGRVRRLELDLDFAGLVVRLDALDVSLGVVLTFVVLGADDRLVERGAARAEVENALHRVLEVTRDNVLAVGVGEPVTQRQRVRQTVLGDLREVLSQTRNQLRAGAAPSSWL